MAITTTSILPPPIAQTYAYKLLRSRTRALIHGLPLEQKVLQRNSGDTLRFRRYIPLKTDTTPLGNSGATPPGQQLTAIDIDAKVQWYGTYVTSNEQVVLTSQDPVLNVLAERLGVFMKETDDELIRNVLASTASIQDSVYGTNGDTPSNFTQQDAAKAYQTFRSNDAFPCIMGRDGSTKINSVQTREAYFALCHTDLITDLDNIPEFVEKIKYPSQAGIRHSEHGTLNGLVFHTSSQGSIDSVLSTNGNKIYNILCAAKECAGRVSLEGNAKFLYTPPLDPLHQNFTAAVKWVQVPKIFNDSYLLRVRATTFR